MHLWNHSAIQQFQAQAELICGICLHFLIYSAKAELDQLKEGLGTLNLLSTMQSHPLKFLPLLTAANQLELTADAVISLFIVETWSPEGSNDREAEEAVIFNWENYIRETAGIYIFYHDYFVVLMVGGIFHTGGRQVCESDQEGVSVCLKQILSFTTGADAIPPLGFPNSPVILFSKDKNRLLPIASTCALSLTFSLGLVEYSIFKNNMDTAVLNAYEFGQV